MPDIINFAVSRTKFKSRLAMIVILLNLLVYCIVGLTLYQSRVKYEKQAVVSTQNLASVLDNFIDGELGSIDMALIAVKNEAEEQIARGGIDKEALNRCMTRLHSYLPSIQSLRMTNSSGDVIFGSHDVTNEVVSNIIDRDYFIFERNNPKGDLFIAKPVLGRDSKKWVLNIARRVNNPDGSFAGTVFGNLTLDHFIKVFSSLDVGKNGSITLRDSELAVIARYPESKRLGNSIGNKTVAKEFTDLIKAGNESATFKARARIDNTDRLFSYRKISDYPLFICVALAKDEYLSGWRKEVLTQLGMVIFFTLVTIFSSRMLLTRWLREKENEDELRRSKNDLERRVEERTTEVRLTNQKLSEELKERKLAEASLRESEWLLNESQKLANIGSYDFDIVNDTWDSSQKLDEIFGIHETFRKDISGWITIIHPEYRERMADYISSIIANKQQFNKEYKIICQNNGAERWVAGFGELKYDESGNVVRVIGTIQNITERKSAEEEKNKLESQLQHAQKMESIGTLAGGIAHDFNNILNVIIGYGSLTLMRMIEDDPQRLNVQHMLDAADRATSLTKDLLLFSRKQVAERKPVDLNLVVVKIEKFLKRVIGEDIASTTILEESPLTVLADEHQLDQVLMNLATNARDSMPQGGSLMLTTENVLLNGEFIATHGYGKPGPYVLITVSDTGMGMDEATQQRIFEPFFTTKEVGKGTGLGLAVVYGIIKQHDGYINVYSELGTGTTFRIYLPAIAVEIEEESRSQEDESAVGGSETILLAEDDESIRLLTKDVLTEFGYRVIEAVDGEDAVRKFVENSATIDLLLFDLIMLNMNGSEAFDEIRKVCLGMKAIFFSGYAPETIRQKVSLLDSAHLISKPIPPKELLRKVRCVLDSK